MPDDKTKQDHVTDDTKKDDKSAELMDRLGTIEKKLDDGQKTTVADQELLASLLAGAGDEDATKEPTKDKINYNDLNNEQLISLVQGVIEDEVGKVEKSFKTRIEETEQTVVNKQVEDEISAAKTKFGKDFDDAWDDTMKVAEKFPNLTAEQAFLLATASKSRGSLTDLLKDKREREDKAAGAGRPSGYPDNALIEKLEGKTTQEVAEEIAGRLGM